MDTTKVSIIEGLKVVTAVDGSQLQYIKVKDALGTQWISNAEKRLKTNRPEHAQGFSPADAMKHYKELLRLGFKGLSLTNAIPV